MIIDSVGSFMGNGTPNTTFGIFRITLSSGNQMHMNMEY
ncbi:uncharacterized protein METZ01_LOCUS196990, partial [marine metagenome]